MKYAPRLSSIALLAAICCALLILSCKSERSTEPPQRTAEYHYIRDYQYETDRIFDLGLQYDFEKGDMITELKAFEGTDDPYEDTLAVYSILALDPTSIFWRRWCEIGTPVRAMDSLSYQWFSDTVKNQHLIVLDSSRTLTALGVWMVIRRESVNSGTGQHIIDTIGSLDYRGDTVVIKMIKPSMALIPSHPCWNLMHRNVYAVPRGELLTDLDVKVFEGAIGSEGTDETTEFQDTTRADSVRFIRILGLDQYNATREKLPDNKVDDRAAIFRPDWGLVMFPSWRPFALDTNFVDANGHRTVPLTTQAPLIYDYLNVNQPVSGSRYFIRYTTWK